MARRAVRGDGQHPRRPAVHPAADQEQPGQHRPHPQNAREPGRGGVEVRALAPVLHGAERAGGAIAGGVPSRDLHADDGHRAVDLPVCCS